MNKSIKLYARPKLKSPNMLAAWPGISGVATIVASYIGRKLDFKTLGWIEAADFFDPIGVLVKENVIEAPQFPQSNFYYLKNKGGKSDVILFIGEAQPATRSYDLANCVLDMAERFEVQRVYTCAAAITRIHHSEDPKAWGAATTPEVAQDLAKYNLTRGGNLHISGLNGILLGVARERNIEGACILGEVPMYATRMQNPMAALAVLRVLSIMLGVDINLGELETQAYEAREKMKQVASQVMGEYIDYFTEPIWEHGEEDWEEE